jgi:uridine kinase
VLDLLPNKDYSYVLCRVNNRTRELTYEITKDSTIEFLRLDNEEATRVYEASLRYLFAMAMSQVYPNFKIKFNYSISRGIYIQILNYNVNFNQDMLRKVDERMKKIILQDLPLVREVVTKEEAKKTYIENGLYDKVSILPYRPEKTVHLYKCGDYLNYMYSHMVPSTGYLQKYSLRKYGKGAFLQFPRAEENGKLAVFTDEKTYAKALNKAGKWAKVIRAETIAEINSHIESNNVIDFVQACETKHNNMLCELGQLIERKKDSVKLIAIAGPSSSGKTTFSHRLKIELLTRGITPVKLSIDDYYIDRDKIPTDEFGNVDLEHINTIDVDLFNQHLVALIQGEEVEIPSFNFKKGRREKGHHLRLPPNSPIIIEGIHALNDSLTPGISRENKFKIYIGPQIQINLDNHNPISITQFRLLRRLVRDHKFRGFDALKTLNIWESVRKGEFRWIYENQEGVDYVFNSELSYEICVMRKHALPLLKQIDAEDEHYITANKIIKFLKLFKDIDDNLVPCNSLLREFIGNSCFHDV